MKIKELIHFRGTFYTNLGRASIKDAGYDTSEYSTHSMRRGIANWIIDSGASVAELKEWIGWRDTRTAMRYLDGKSSLPSKIIERKFKEGLSNDPNKDKLEYDAK